MFKEPIVIHLWYLYLLIGLYLMTQFLQKKVHNFKDKDYFYLIIITLIIPSVLGMVSIYTNIQISPYWILHVKNRDK